MASLQYAIWRTPSVPDAVTLDYLQDWDPNNYRMTDFEAKWPVEMT